MNSPTAGPEFAGVDGSAGALAAVPWAAADLLLGSVSQALSGRFSGPVAVVGSR